MTLLHLLDDLEKSGVSLRSLAFLFIYFIFVEEVHILQAFMKLHSSICFCEGLLMFAEIRVRLILGVVDVGVVGLCEQIFFMEFFCGRRIMHSWLGAVNIFLLMQ